MKTKINTTYKDFINISIKDSNYIDFLSDLYNFFKIKTLK